MNVTMFEAIALIIRATSRRVVHYLHSTLKTILRTIFVHNSGERITFPLETNDIRIHVRDLERRRHVRDRTFEKRSLRYRLLIHIGLIGN